MSSPPSKPKRARTSSAWVISRSPALVDLGALGRGEQLRRSLQPGRGRLEQRVQDVLRGPLDGQARYRGGPARPVDRSYGVYLVSVPRTTTLVIGAPRTPAAIWAITVRAPWPSSVVPTRT